MSEVIVGLQGGMGNQMFQYAAARALAARQGAELVLDCAWFDQIQGLPGVTERKYALAPFALPAQTRSTGLPVTPAPGLLARLVARATRKLMRHVPVRRDGAAVYNETSFTYDEEFFRQEAPVWLNGYWQSFRYFEPIAADIRRELGTPRVMSEATRAMLEKIRSVRSVCVHVRRGDYVSNASASEFHGLCGIDYYLRGLEYVLGGDHAAHCFVFSDDPEWVRGNMRLPFEITIVDINGANDAHEDLWLMAACRDFVIANSSMSWWGAWLAEHPKKRVVAPQEWFKSSRNDTRDLIPPEWKRL